MKITEKQIMLVVNQLKESLQADVSNLHVIHHLNGFYLELIFTNQIELRLSYDGDVKTLEIVYINIPEELRNKGIGTKVVRVIENTMKELGAQIIILTSDDSAKGFWEKVDFNEEIKNVYKKAL